MSDGVRSSARLPLVAVIGVGGLILLLVAFAVYALIMFWNVPESSDRANFGSMFGLPGAFFGSLALLGVAWALVLQHQAAERDKQRLSNDVEALQKSLRLSALAVIAPWVEAQLDRLERNGNLGSDGAIEMAEFRDRVLLEVESAAGLVGPVTEEVVRQRSLRSDKPRAGKFEF